MIKQIADIALRIAGWTTEEQLILFLSDDWGCSRIDSVGQKHSLEAAGVSTTTNRFNQFDSLESDDDLEQLFQTLEKHPDGEGRLPLITAMTIVANPHFAKIKEANYEAYFYQTVRQTWNERPGSQNVAQLYQLGAKRKIFVPEYHGREHLNVRRWMDGLRRKDTTLMRAFEHQFYLPDPATLLVPLTLSAAYDLDARTELHEQRAILDDGLRVFHGIFERPAFLFTPPAHTCHEHLLAAEGAKGLRLVDFPRRHRMPIGGGRTRSKYRTQGSTLKSGQHVIHRNATFETNMGCADPVGSCMKQIQRAFAFKQPAIISNHRACFVGTLDEHNRTQGLHLLDELLRRVRTTFPKAIFVNPEELFQRMQQR